MSNMHTHTHTHPTQELLTMIDLDITVYDMFDLPPLSEYEVYIKNFGSDNTRQVSSDEKQKPYMET